MDEPKPNKKTYLTQDSRNIKKIPFPKDENSTNPKTHLAFRESMMKTAVILN